MANDRISDLVVASTLTGAELFEVSQPSGSTPPYNSRKALLSAINAYILANLPATGSGGGMGPPGLDGLDGDDLLMIPGPTGPTGPQGPQGVPGSGGGGSGNMGPPGLDGADPDDPMMIPGPAGAAGSSGTGGTSTYLNGNVSPDTHPASPTARDDEFEQSALSSQWTNLNWNQQSGSPATSANVYSGSLVFTSEKNLANVRDPALLVQPILAAQVTAGAWTYRAKIAQYLNGGTANLIGMALYETATGKVIDINCFNGNNSSIAYRSSFSSFSQLSGPNNWPAYADSIVQDNQWRYFQISLSAGTLTWSLSVNGLEYHTYYSEAVNAHFTTAPDKIGFLVESVNTSTLTVLNADWFRDYTSGYAPSTGLPIQNFNVTPDTHTATPTFVANDEFEGASLDTAGTRFTGAIPWTWNNQGAATAVLGNGSVLMTADTIGGDFNNVITQPISGTWTFQMKFKALQGAVTSTNSHLGIITYNSASGRWVVFGLYCNSVGQYGSLVQRLNSLTSSSSNVLLVGNTVPAANYLGSTDSAWLYLKLQNDGTNLIFSMSLDGYEYHTVYTEPLSGWLGAAPTAIGLDVNNAVSGGTPSQMLVDWFRRAA